MKILLLHSGIHFTAGKKIKRNKIITEYTLPLGILYLGEILKNDYSVRLYDHAVVNISIEKLVKWIIKSDFDIIGYSVLGGSFITSIEIAKKVKSQNENIINVFGGIQATLCAREILEKYGDVVDYCVRGEGEYTFKNLLKSIESGSDIKEIRGITYRENNIVKSTENAPLIQNLDMIPIPDRKLLTKYHNYILTNKTTPVITSRGCVYNCRFCSNNIIYNRSIRYRSVENIIEELLYLESEGFKEISIVDDCFTTNYKRVIEICEKIRKSNIDIQFHCTTRTNLCNYNMLRHMKKAGCATLSIGFESANQRILDYYNKQTKVEDSIRCIKNVKKAQIANVVGAFIIGAPTETVNEVINTIKFGLKLNISSIQFQLLYVSPGTSIYKEFQEKGWIEPDGWEKPLIAADISPEVLPREYLERLVESAYIHILSNPKRIFSDYIRSIKSKYRSSLFKTIPSQIRKILAS